MTHMRTTPVLLLALVFMWTLSSGCSLVAAAGQDSLARAKELYSSAAYDEALAMLDGLQAGSSAGASASAAEDSGRIAAEVWLYQAFCLLALGRTDEAKKVIERMVTADPLHRLSDAQASPRVMSVFQDVRRAVLPSAAQRAYAEAKQTFDRKDPRASAQFERVLALIDDPDMQGTATPDFRTLVVGFRDLSLAVAPSTAQPPPSVDTARPPAVTITPAGDAGATVRASAPAAAAPAAPGRPVVVIPPLALSQPMPRWVPATTADARRVFTGRLEIAIDEGGNVVSAVLEAPIYPSYDEELLSLARSWRFKPATQNGAPIPFVKIFQIQLQQRR